MYFVRSGFISLPDGSLQRAGTGGYSWSSSAFPAGTRGASSFDFASTNTLPSGSGTRYYGFSLQPHFSLKTSCCSIKESTFMYPKKPKEYPYK